MEHSMNPYASYVKATPYGLGNTAVTRKQKELEEHAKEQEERSAQVRRAGAVTAIAQLMVEQNEKMIAGLKASAAMNSEPPAGPVNFVERNMRAVGSQRSTIGIKEQRLMARAEAMAMATKHLGDGTPSQQAPKPVHAPYPLMKSDRPTSAELVRAAREEVERGMAMSGYEAQTRRAPPKMPGLGRGGGWRNC